MLILIARIFASQLTISRQSNLQDSFEPTSGFKFDYHGAKGWKIGDNMMTLGYLKHICIISFCFAMKIRQTCSVSRKS